MRLRSVLISALIVTGIVISGVAFAQDGIVSMASSAVYEFSVMPDGSEVITIDPAPTDQHRIRISLQDGDRISVVTDIIASLTAAIKLETSPSPEFSNSLIWKIEYPIH